MLSGKANVDDLERVTLQMDVGVRETLPCYLNELVHEFVVLLTTDPALSKTQIQLIVEKLLVLGSFS